MAAKLRANLAALEVLEACRREGRWATPEEQAVLARWSGWGALPQVFDDASDRYRDEQARVRELLGSEDAWDQARRTTLNAHYTSAEVAQAMWKALGDLGFTTGRVLEPGCGSGVFLGFAPEEAEMVGVELDATTARVAEHLYGARAHIHQGGFEGFAQPEGSFDAVIGNVPFGKVSPFDPQHNRGNHKLHNYFLVKSLKLTRPGGLVVALTSRYTLDAQNLAARREMARLADLVGAVRLPAGAFATSSGTDVVTDLLVLRRRQPGAPPEGPAWVRAVPLETADGLSAEARAALDAAGVPVMVSEYFAERREMVLGDLGIGRAMYRDHDMVVTPNGPLGEQLPAALDRLVTEARDQGAVLTGRPVVRGGAPGTVTRSGGGGGGRQDEYDTRHAQQGSLVLGTGGVVGRFTGTGVEPYRPKNNADHAELRRLIGLRDAVRQVLSVQLVGDSDAELAAAQRELTDLYRAYTRFYGPLNRYSLVRSRQRDPETGGRTWRRRFPTMGGFRATDPDWPLVAALEVFDDDTRTAQLAPVFTLRIVAPPAQRTRTDTPADAVAVCLDESGMVTTERVAELLGVSEAQARERLGELVFEDPVTRELVPAARYLAGNVRRKLHAARSASEPAAAATAAPGGPGGSSGPGVPGGASNVRRNLHAAGGAERWQRNVAALEAAMPRQLKPREITARLGASWIPASDVEAFCREVLDARVDVEHMAAIGRWAVKLRTGDRRSVALSSVWGTKRASAVNLLDASLNQRLHVVYDTIDDGDRKKRVRNDAETLAARDKQEALGNRFSEWVWEDADRARRLAGTYNELFRSVRLTDHDGSHLTFPGLAATFTPRRHQRDAVARILTDGRALLAHAVGAGKTATMVMAAMELRRLGSATKPAVVVPNHMLEQFSREWLQLYPTARILVADADQLDAAHRRDFVARCALGDWDGIVFTRSGFEKIPLGRDLLAEYLKTELDAARRALTASKNRSFTVKRLERMIAQAEETYKKLLAAHTKDTGIRFEETGIDYLFVDEAHLFKNRRVVTEVDGVAHPGSRRAQDLDAKLWALRRLHGPRTVTFATATPVANSMAEMWVMQSYLQPDVLAAAGVRTFDAWAANFGRTHTALELAPDGASYRMKTRFSRFQNIPELLGLYHQVADVRTADDLALPTPTVAGGAPETVVVDGSDALHDYVAELAARAEAIRSRAVDPQHDNMLAVATDGRRAALDLRLVGLPPDPDGGKVTAAARRIATIYETTRDTTYTDPAGQPSPRAGALQLVFCDVATNAARGWNPYDELRHQLTRRGVPRDAIRYMQDATSHDAKAALFAACRDGQVAVLIGSTETMGVGTNVQRRAIALHHLDAPWRPADIEQREGRILRQGNQNPQVEIIRYVTEGSFDTYMWQTLERKAAFIHQVSHRNFDEREADDIGDQVLSFAEVKALATGDPRIMEKAEVDTEVARLTRLQRAWHDDRTRLHHIAINARGRAENATARADQLAQTAARIADTRGDRFTMAVEGRNHTSRTDAGEHLHHVLTRQLAATPFDTTTEPRPVAQLAGLDVAGQTTTTIDNEIRLLVPGTDIQLRYLELEWRTTDPAQVVQRLERHIRQLPDTVERYRTEATTATEDAERAETQLAQPWEHTDQLNHLRRRQQELNEAVSAADNTPPPEPGRTGPEPSVGSTADHAPHDALALSGIGERGTSELIDQVRSLRRLGTPRQRAPDAGPDLGL